jgi:pimeloyl-ACP methyl ester carboxylesterase
MVDVAATITWVALATGLLALIVYSAAKVVEHRNPPIGNFIEIDGTSLHYVESGSGIPVLFLHGNATMLQDLLLSNAFASAAERGRALVFDRPGFGYSTRPGVRSWSASEQADVLAEALRHLNCNQAVIVGHSWGTLVAVAMSQRHPALVRSLVLLSGYFFPAPRFDTALAAAAATPVIGAVLRYTLTPVFGLLMLPLILRAMFGPCDVPLQFRRAFPRLMMLRPWQLRASLSDGAQMLRSAAELQPGYQTLQIPVFIVAGADDRLVDHWHSKKLHEELRASQLDIIPHVGHMVQHSAGDRVAGIINRLLNLVL